MSCQIILNSSNWISGTNKFQYVFPSAQNFHGKEVALTTCNINNQFFNIRSTLGNNVIILVWPTDFNGAAGKLFKLTLPDGYYSISDINASLQAMMYSNSLYTTDSKGNINYYVDIEANSTYYTADITTTIIPYMNAAAAGQTFPSGFPSYTGVSLNLAPYLLFNAPLGALLGYTTNKFQNNTAVSGIAASSVVIAGSGGTVATLTGWGLQVPIGNPTYKGFKQITVVSSSDVSPEINLVTSIIVGCSLINNIGISNPTHVINSMPVSSVAIGNQITLPNSYPIYQPVASNQYREVVISFLDQLAAPVYIFDPDVLIILSIRDAKEKKKQPHQ